MIRRPQRSTLFPDTPLSRSILLDALSVLCGLEHHDALTADKVLWSPPDLRVYLLSDGGCPLVGFCLRGGAHAGEDRKSTRLNSSHANISYAVFCLKKKKKIS